jgi:acyl-lipid omega-6 desaturase (Delta-12 desaturase)
MAKVNSDNATAQFKQIKQINWKELIAPYRQPSLARSLWQLANTLIPFLALYALMYYTLTFSFWLTLALAPLTAAFLVRLFIIFHDCCHGSFFKSRRLNDLVGVVCGILCITPYDEWRHSHALHHATSGNLDKRAANQTYPVRLRKYIQDGYGILTVTIPEYEQFSRKEKWGYRLYRNPFFLLLLVPPLQFMVFQRYLAVKRGKKERRSVLVTNLAWLAIILVMGFTVGFGPFFLITLLTISLAAIAGVWLFYVQHIYEDVYWKFQNEWDYETSALAGSSFYKLPRILQWFSGNIGFHHVHHLNPRIPNYYLEKCHNSHPAFQNVITLNLRQSVKSMTLTLWDIEQQKMVGFNKLPQD